MLMKTRRFLRSFTPYQIGYLTTVLLITAAFAVFFPDLMLEETSSKFVTACSVVAVLANPVCELLISKQSKLNFLVDALLIEIPEFMDSHRYLQLSSMVPPSRPAGGGTDGGPAS